MEKTIKKEQPFGFEGFQAVFRERPSVVNPDQVYFFIGRVPIANYSRRHSIDPKVKGVKFYVYSLFSGMKKDVFDIFNTEEEAMTACIKIGAHAVRMFKAAAREQFALFKVVDVQPVTEDSPKAGETVFACKDPSARGIDPFCIGVVTQNRSKVNSKKNHIHVTGGGTTNWQYFAIITKEKEQELIKKLGKACHR